MILTKPVSLQKGVKHTFTLSLSEVLALPKVANDDYYSIPANIRAISLAYKSPQGNQHESVIFQMNSNSEIRPSVFHVSKRARNDFSLMQLIIHDFDGGSLVVQRSDIADAASMDISLPASSVDNLLNYISNYNGDSVSIGTLAASNSSTSIGQSFTMSSQEALKAIHVRAKGSGSGSATLTAAVYSLASQQLIGSSNAVLVSSIGTEFSDVEFAFDFNLPGGSYYFLITPSEALPTPIEFLGKTTNAQNGGALFSSGTWSPESDMDFNLYVE